MCVIWQHNPCDMYINLHTIGLTGATELGTVTCHFAPNRRRFHWLISQWILLRRKHIFGKSLKSSLGLFVPSFRFFSTFSKHEITILVKISQGNRSLTSYMYVFNLHEFIWWFIQCMKKSCIDLHISQSQWRTFGSIKYMNYLVILTIWRNYSVILWKKPECLNCHFFLWKLLTHNSQEELS